jgi:spore coat polysaccharide biosynthesis protein SpsF
MSSTLGVVEVPARDSPARRSLTSWAARPLGGKPLVEWIIRRLTDAMLLDHTVVIAPDAEQAAGLARFVPGDAVVFVSDQATDPLARLAAAVRTFRTRAIVRVKADHPFVDPSLVDRLIARAESHPNCDCMTYCSSRGQPMLLARLGMLAEWYRGDAVLRADAQATHPDDRQDLSRFVRSHPEAFQVRLIPLPASLDRDDWRLAISDEEDWDHAQMILDALGPDNLDWQGIARLLESHPALRQRMAAMNESDIAAASSLAASR